MLVSKRIVLSPLTVIAPAVLLLFVYLGSVLSSNAYEDFDYGIHYAVAQAQHGYWTQAYANEMIQRSLMTFLPSLLTPILFIAGVVVILLVIQRRLRL